MSDWKPIETAPKDGTNILVYDGKYIRTATWEGDRWNSVDLQEFYYKITYWMPLPEPPKKTHYCVQHNWICKEVKDTRLQSFKKYVIFHESNFTEVLCCDQCPFCGEKA